MHKQPPSFRLWVLLVALLMLSLPSCSDDESEDDEAPDESVTVGLEVVSDQVFGFVADSYIGTATFSDHDGLVGTPIRCEIELDEFERFQEKTLSGLLELINPDAIKDDQFVYDFLVDEEEESFTFYIPQIVTAPIYLNFRLSLYYEEEDVSGNLDTFTAELIYEFNVNTGRPAT